MLYLFRALSIFLIVVLMSGCNDSQPDLSYKYTFGRSPLFISDKVSFIACPSPSFSNDCKEEEIVKDRDMIKWTDSLFVVDSPADIKVLKDFYAHLIDGIYLEEVVIPEGATLKNYGEQNNAFRDAEDIYRFVYKNKHYFLYYERDRDKVDMLGEPKVTLWLKVQVQDSNVEKWMSAEGITYAFYD